MCGIIGVLNHTDHRTITQSELREMLAMIRHRGPDQFGIYLDEAIGLGNARLSILDLETGQQPISNEDGTLWIVYNGEIFNYVDLIPLISDVTFSPRLLDTEVILHLL
jgi:asparagine synthase (glutamine-hydrolysing)